MVDCERMKSARKYAGFLTSKADSYAADFTLSAMSNEEVDAYAQRNGRTLDLSKEWMN